MKTMKLAVLAAVAATLAACATGPDKSRDRGIDSKNLSELEWGIWVDPTGCDTWIADDGVEGYLVRRLDRYGKPVCSGVAPPNVATGPFKEGSAIPDLL
jgi:ABC-type oligopeptide transport system substrate-binding subunit